MKIFGDIFVMPLEKNKNENKLDENIVLIANFVPSTPFCNKRKAIFFFFFFKIALWTMLLSCRVNIYSAKTFLKFSEESRVCSWKFRKHLCWSFFLIKPEDLQIYLKETPCEI